MNKKRIQKIAFITLSVLTVLAGASYLLPSNWKVERSIVIQADPEKIFPHIADFKVGWPKWSAFDQEDQTIVYQYAGPDSGTGATRSWKSKKMGDGTQRIVKADPKSGITFELDMPSSEMKILGVMAFDSSNVNETKVTWVDSGNTGMNPICRYIFFFGMDKIMGNMFDKSLKSLKLLAESTR